MPSVEQDPTDSIIGLLIDGRYRVSARLARGGMATVYVAHDERLDRPVALKIMHPHLAESADFIQRFQREARAAARIIYPGVVSVFDQGMIHGRGFIVMELIDGTNLRSLLQAQGTFTIAQSLRYIEEIFEALQAAHRMGVIHRDIKPENILVAADGSVRVTDFGLARAASEVSMSTTGAMLGTIAYMAPEIATTKKVDARTDIYSVGIMLYEMLVGEVPWAGDTALNVAYAHVNNDIPAPSEQVQWIPREIDDLVATLAARDPDERPIDTKQTIKLVVKVRAAIPPEILSQRARPTAGSPSNKITQTSSIPQLDTTAALPPKIAHISQKIIHTTSTQTSKKRLRSKRKRIVIAFLAVFLTLAASLAGVLWWWPNYGPGSLVVLPDLKGQNQASAQSELVQHHLSSEILEEFSDSVDSGLVISTNPQSGQKISRDTRIQLIISKGIEMRSVPDLSTSDEDSAKRILSESALQVGSVTHSYSETVPLGRLIKQSIAPGTSIKHGSIVNLEFSKGREPIKVPALVGRNENEAKKILTQMGLIANPTEAFSDSVEKGTVISQQMTPGSTLYRGDNVTYAISKGPELVTIPEIPNGSKSDEVKKKLEDLGLKVKVSTPLGVGTSFLHIVYALDPSSGTAVPKGSTVTMSVI